MKKDFDWEKFKQKKITVYCKTLEEFEDFLNETKNKKITWSNGNTINIDKDWTYWYKNTKRTAVFYSLLFPCGICCIDVRYWNYESRCNDNELIRWSEYMNMEN